MAITLVQDTADSGSGTSNNATFTSTPTSGNLLVLFGGGRDDDNSTVPTIASITSGWTVIATSSPMERHICFIAWKQSDGTESGTIGWTTTEECGSMWTGLAEFSSPGVSSWVVDATNAAGSNTSNVSSIASGSTGTLDANALVGVVAGCSRTANDGLSISGITGLTAFGDAELGSVDAGSANYIAQYWEVSGTTAQQATVSESTGSSRMGAAIAVFAEDAGSTTTVDSVASTSAASSAVAGIVATTDVAPVASASANTSAVAGIAATAEIAPAASTSATSSGVANIATDQSVYVDEDFTATTTGDLTTDNLIADELGNGWVGDPAAFAYEADGSGVSADGAAFDAAFVQTDGREDVRVTWFGKIERGAFNGRWPGFAVRSISSTYNGTDTLSVVFNGVGGATAPTLILADGISGDTALKEWDLDALMTTAPVEDDDVEIVLLAEGDDITLYSVAVNGASAEVLDDTYTLTSTPATDHGASSGADYYGIIMHRAGTASRIYSFTVSSLTAVTSTTVDPVGSVSGSSSATAAVSATAEIDPAASTSATSSAVADVSSGAIVDPAGSVSVTTSATAGITATVTVDPAASASATASATAGVDASATITATASTSATTSAVADITTGVIVDPSPSTSTSSSDTASVTATVTVDPVGSGSSTFSATAGVIASTIVDPVGSNSAASSDTANIQLGVIGNTVGAQIIMVT